MSSLSFLNIGEKAEVVEIKTEKGHGCGKKEKHICHVEDMGLRIGNVVEVLNNEGQGPLVVKVNESRIAIGRDMAMKIMVKRIEE
ncbi:ferrous iron transport protein A [Candidatus Hakubella thermalkaliphila]|uniref:Ferrous iron transport protein A n=2 Tax=Candidatus Hakubella thermalkaliphila TaxID=2754717 RepID=A0A6V8NH78_9ACTN|nr:FeoA family protein [Candidatus Hakubella thermalkaliphila]GFP19662.1 ferrous iron transport protein A [Candidatus Hakubella thermalkaliphila]GFP24026.1 ferrous iron transport protein A [Candidatus Hakubella thermalkaliphila]GFP24984.1 ferrous iron transport protein A [Candidatus Hakubella thermalkaliphila]GFP26674.1 ferrous iron transport protein A [Candidatus Hakubella thermalkaliphila]GFP29195.1 ferrous iron transport protein A [Candidatus Hakubella thermalkaliphila]